MRVSADTKTCGSPLYLSPTGGLCLPSGKHAIRLTYYQTIVNKKMKKKNFFWAAEGTPLEDRRHVSNGVNGFFSREKAQKGQKNDQKSAL